MELEDIIDALKELSCPYPYPPTVNEIGDSLAKSGLHTPWAMSVVSWLSSELNFFLQLDESVSNYGKSGDWDAFVLELSSFLRDMGGCPPEADVERLRDSKPNHLEFSKSLLAFLTSELQTVRITMHNNPMQLKSLIANSGIVVSAPQHVIHLVDVFDALGISVPPREVTVQQLFTVINKKIQDRKAAAPRQLISSPALKVALGTRHLNELEEINRALASEYSVRRRMLHKRLECTIDSFTWSDRLSGKKKDIEAVARSRIEGISTESKVDISDLFAARDDITLYYKTSSSIQRRNTISKLNKVLMGKVADRGGRPHETGPPPEEPMPSFKSREAAPPQHSNRGRPESRGKNRGQRVQGSSSNMMGGYQQYYGHDNRGFSQNTGGYQNSGRRY